MNNDRFSKNAKSIRFKALCFTLAVHSLILGSLIYSTGGAKAADLLPDLPDFVKEYFDGGQEEVETGKDVKKKKAKKPQA